MREIIFRGKRVDNGEWEHGVPVSITHGVQMICEEYDDVEVIPETVGQYTGLVDKNGTMIFEGDIIEFRGEERVVVYFEHGKFTADFKEYEYLGFDEIFWDHIDGVEIIGNIHDNGEGV